MGSGTGVQTGAAAHVSLPTAAPPGPPAADDYQVCLSLRVTGGPRTGPGMRTSDSTGATWPEPWSST